MYGNYSFSLDSLLDDKDFTGDFVSFSGSFAVKESENAANLVYYKDMQAAARKSAEAAAGNLYNSTVRSSNIDFALAKGQAEVDYHLQSNQDELQYLAGETADYLAYLGTINTAQAIYEAEQCRLAGLLQDSVNTGYNNIADGTSSLDVQVCFIEGFEIDLTDGTSKKIEEFKGDEEVFARPHNDPNGPLMKCKVVHVLKNEPKETVKVRFDNGLELQGTAEHPFYVQDKGWVSLNDLQIGDSCVDKEGKGTKVVSKELVTEKLPVYNIEVEGAHTYYIGKNGKSLLVHNECSCSGWRLPTADEIGLNKLIDNTYGALTRLVWHWQMDNAKPYSQLPLGEDYHTAKRDKLNENEKFLAIADILKKDYANPKLKEKADSGEKIYVTINEQHYVLYPSSLSIYHSINGDGEDCYKYVGINGNGKELVLDAMGNVDLSPERQGTYNYSTSDTISGTCWHTYYDVLPYWWDGNSSNDTTHWLKRIHPKLPENIQNTIIFIGPTWF